MKQIKAAFLFFCLFSLSFFYSCNKKITEKKEVKSIIDSVDVFIFKMKNDTVDLKTRINYANKALQKIKNHKSDARIIEVLDSKVKFLGALKQYDSCIYNSKKILQKSIEINDSVSIGRSYTLLAYYHSIKKQNDSAYFYYSLIKNQFLKYSDSISNGYNLMKMSIIEKSVGDYNSSEYTGSLALKYLNGNSPSYSASVYNNWAISSRNQGQLQDALLFYNKALVLIALKEDKIIIKNNIANTYRDLGDYNKSIDILNSLNKDSIINQIIRAKVIDNLAYTKWLAKKNGDILSELEKALAIRLQEKDHYGLIASYAHLSKYYKFLSTDKAQFYASKMYEVATVQKSTQDRLEALQILIELDNTSNIKKHYRVYVKINDSIKVVKSKAKNAYAKIKYNSEKNREDNLKLKIVNSKKELELEKIRTRNVIGATSSATVVFGLIGFGYYRRKKYKQEKRAEVYKTETRIAKKIHDEVANNVVNIMNKVQYTNETKENLLDDLEKVYMLTRNISHQNSTIETGDRFESSLKTLLTSFNTGTRTVILKDIHKVELKLLASDKQIEIYRILQELMVNMQKHSKANLVALSFKYINYQYSINYSDNGVGLAINKISLKNGLKNVETRIKSINGVITFETSVNNGFKVFISFKR